MQSLALLICIVFVWLLFSQEKRRRGAMSPALWAVFLWLVVIGSRGISDWFSVGRVVGDAAQAYDEGSPIDRNGYLVLMFVGVVTLFRRRVLLSDVIRQNRWLCIFFIYCLASVLWADAPFVAFKRWFKNAGNLLMVLVVLSDEDPVEAARAVFYHCGALLIPLSVLFIRYYPELGRAYHVTGEMMFTGVATHKNTLGMLVMVCGLFLVWDFIDRLARRLEDVSRIGLLADVILVAMTLWLLIESHSSTSQACFVIGLGILLIFQVPKVRARADSLGLVALVGGGCYYFLNSLFDINRFIVVDLLGRNMTLTTRTEIWPILLSHAENPLLGAGFCSYWSGSRLELLYNKYKIIQAHNGYLETYLDTGLIGVLLLVIIIITITGRIKSKLSLGSDYQVVRLMFLVIAVIHNFTEASFNQIDLLWFSFLLVVTEYSVVEEKVEVASAPVDEEDVTEAPTPGLQPKSA